jgi:NAD(P)-dependent dehydrogenase (short-subunit alcohol dehydrogenase family)
MGKLNGKVAIVTGAGRGIGRVIAEAYLQEGASVTITAARNPAELDHLAKSGWSDHVLALLADVTDPQACEKVVEQTIQRFGQVDVLVNNAARGMQAVSSAYMTKPPPFWEVAPATWRMMIETNVNGPFYMTRPVVKYLLPQRRGGSIIGISTSYGTMKRRGYAPYGPSKAALEAASAIWAQELSEAHIRVNILLPGGATDTSMIPAEIPENVRAGLLPPEIMKAPAVFLASDSSQDITGHRVIAAQWSPAHPKGSPILEEIG